MVGLQSMKVRSDAVLCATNVWGRCPPGVGLSPVHGDVELCRKGPCAVDSYFAVSLLSWSITHVPETTRFFGMHVVCALVTPQLDCASFVVVSGLQRSTSEPLSVWSIRVPIPTRDWLQCTTSGCRAEPTRFAAVRGHERVLLGVGALAPAVVCAVVCEKSTAHVVVPTHFGRDAWLCRNWRVRHCPTHGTLTGCLEDSVRCDVTGTHLAAEATVRKHPPFHGDGNFGGPCALT